MKFNVLTDLRIEHHLNEALRNCLEDEGIKIKDAVSNDVGLEHDYYELLNSFEEHLKFIIKLNNEVNKNENKN